jgi:hypothetical protein
VVVKSDCYDGPRVGVFLADTAAWYFMSRVASANDVSDGKLRETTALQAAEAPNLRAPSK